LQEKQKLKKQFWKRKNYIVTYRDFIIQGIR